MIPKKLQRKLEERALNNSLRTLGCKTDLIDFSSNDYLGFSKSEKIFKRAAEILKAHDLEVNGATGSRLLSGNHPLYEKVENVLTEFHQCDATLIFNSGYDANIGFFSSVPQRGDLIFYDELCHASIRDGMKMSNAKSYKFEHNSVDNLSSLVERCATDIGNGTEIYIVTEAVFSMDGDCPDLHKLAKLCKEQGYHLVVDEAHAVGVFGESGVGLVQELGLEKEVFARIVTFGKAMGCHGAAILGGHDLKNYLVNFARSFIYTTGLPPHTLATILSAYQQLSEEVKGKQKLHTNIAILQLDVRCSDLHSLFIPSRSAIHSCLISGNDKVKKISDKLKEKGFDVKPILSPTVPAGEERLRICLHSYNSQDQIKELVQELLSVSINNPKTKI